METALFAGHATNSVGKPLELEQKRLQQAIDQAQELYEGWRRRNPRATIFDVQLATTAAGEKWNVHLYVTIMVVYRPNVTLADRVKNLLLRLVYPMRRHRLEGATTT